MHEYKASVVRIVDGDTMDVLIDYGFKEYGEKRLRLAGPIGMRIDTPEIFNPSCPAELDHGRLAKAFVEKVCPVGTVVTIITHKTKKGAERKTFGRYVMEVKYPLSPGLTGPGTEDLALMLRVNKFEKREHYER